MHASRHASGVSRSPRTFAELTQRVRSPYQPDAEYTNWRGSTAHSPFHKRGGRNIRRVPDRTATQTSDASSAVRYRYVGLIC